MTDYEPGWLPTSEQSDAMKEQGIELSGLNVTEQWKSDATAMVILLANSAKTFTANDVWAHGLEMPPNKRALSVVFRELKADGFIRDTGVKESSRWGHGQPISVWTKA
jgi:hypothetical protein